MCGGSNRATPYVAQPYNYTKTPAPYGTSGTATPNSTIPGQSSAYPSYGNRYQPAQGMSQQTMAMLQALRDRVMSRNSGVPSQGMDSSAPSPDTAVATPQNTQVQSPSVQAAPPQVAPQVSSWTGGGHLPANGWFTQPRTSMATPAKPGSLRGGVL